MQKLVIKDGMTLCEVVRYYFAEYGEEECEELLMSETVYPFGSLEWIGEEIWVYYLKNRN